MYFSGNPMWFPLLELCSRFHQQQRAAIFMILCIIEKGFTIRYTSSPFFQNSDFLSTFTTVVCCWARCACSSSCSSARSFTHSKSAVSLPWSVRPGPETSKLLSPRTASAMLWCLLFSSHRSSRNTMRLNRNSYLQKDTKVHDLYKVRHLIICYIFLIFYLFVEECNQ